MRVKGSYAPQPLEMEVIGDKAILRFYENVEEVTEEDETPSVICEYDRYTIERPYDDGLLVRINNNLPEWLEMAKGVEYNSLASEVRARRNRLLEDTDKTQLSDSPGDVDTKNAYRVYRQALRDIPEQSGFPYSVQFPAPVAAL